MKIELNLKMDSNTKETLINLINEASETNFPLNIEFEFETISQQRVDNSYEYTTLLKKMNFNFDMK